MKTTLVLAATAALLATAGLASANAYDHYILGYYIICGPPPEVWEETNGVPGLQKSPWTDGHGVVHPADKAVLIFEPGSDVGRLLWWLC